MGLKLDHIALLTLELHTLDIWNVGSHAGERLLPTELLVSYGGRVGRCPKFSWLIREKSHSTRKPGTYFHSPEFLQNLSIFFNFRALLAILGLKEPNFGLKLISFLGVVIVSFPGIIV